jgi:carotenoid cleavage dioxygenase-like enzyme
MSDVPLGFRTWTAEDEATDAALAVEGTLPDWLDGTFLANGPGLFEVGGRTLRHWFDPLALLRRFRVDGAAEEVEYAARFVESRDYDWARRRGRVRTPFPGTPPDRSLPVRVYQALAGEFPDNPAIGVACLAGEPHAVTESRWATPFDADSLAFGERRDVAAGLDCDLTLGHVHYDPGARAFVGLGADYGRDPGYVLFRRPANSTVPTQLARVEFPELPYVHSFALAERYAVVPAVPFGLDPSTLLRGAVTGETFLDAFRERNRPARFVVVDRGTGATVARPPADPFFTYHHANAFAVRGDGTDGVDGPGGPDGPAVGHEGREGGAGATADAGSDAGAGSPTELVVDLVAYPDERAVTGLTLPALRAGTADVPAGDLVRYRVPLDGGRATATTLREGPVEFPTVHYRRYNGRPYRYAYLAETRTDGVLPTHLAKVDVADGGTLAGEWTAPACRPGEAVFAPAPDPGAEDDGVLVSLVLDEDREESFLLVLDATTMDELARARLPHATPFPFHGQFYDAADPVRSMQ